MNPITYLHGEIDIKKFKKGPKINKGGFGTVYQVKDIKTSKEYAAKIIDCGDDELQCKKMIGREIKIMMDVQHPAIVKFIGYSRLDFNEDNNVTIIMELEEKGSLSDVIKKIMQSLGPEDYTNTQRQIIITGIARGMKYLHDRKIIHRDLKLSNILLDKFYHPHITDFGLSKYLDSNNSYSQSMFGGTVPYKAPEIIREQSYNEKVDVYSFGILMFEIITDSFAYPELIEKKMSVFEFNNKVVNDNYRPKFTFPIKKSIKELIKKCWSANPKDRPSFDEIFDKLSNPANESNIYLLDDVDVNEFACYIDDISEATDNTEKLLNKIATIEKEKEELNKYVIKLKKENEQLLMKLSKYERKKQELIQEKKSEIMKITQETKKVDVVFLLDRRNSDEFLSLKDKIDDLAFDMNISNRQISFQHACICYRNLNGNKNLYQFYDFDEELENLVEFLKDVKPQEIDGPGNFAGVLNKALKKLSYRNCMKVIVWLANGNAYGKKYCGYRTDHEEEEKKLDKLVEELAKNNFFMVCISVNGTADLTFNEMKDIYNENDGVSFVIRDFTIEKSDEIDEIINIWKDY